MSESIDAMEARSLELGVQRVETGDGVRLVAAGPNDQPSVNCNRSHNDREG